MPPSHFIYADENVFLLVPTIAFFAIWSLLFHACIQKAQGSNLAISFYHRVSKPGVPQCFRLFFIIFCVISQTIRWDMISFSCPQFLIYEYETLKTKLFEPSFHFVRKSVLILFAFNFLIIVPYTTRKCIVLLYVLCEILPHIVSIGSQFSHVFRLELARRGADHEARV
jgi:hypothetical protein